MPGLPGGGADVSRLDEYYPVERQSMLWRIPEPGVSLNYRRLDNGRLIAIYQDFVSWTIKQDRAQRDEEFLRSVGIKP